MPDYSQVLNSIRCFGGDLPKIKTNTISTNFDQLINTKFAVILDVFPTLLAWHVTILLRTTTFAPRTPTLLSPAQATHKQRYARNQTLLSKHRTRDKRSWSSRGVKMMRLLMCFCLISSCAGN